MKEVVIVSGKGGTGKTSLTAAFGSLAENAVLADCDVDAADMHLLLEPKILQEETFTGGVSVAIDPERCVQCGECREACRFDAIGEDFVVNPVACEGCAVCYYVCPAEAVTLEERVCGRFFVSDTRFGPMVHARLGIAEENSGKLVAQVRQRAKEIAEERGCALILVDGPPGVGCPVISSLTGADFAVIVVEPTVSGIHDMERVADLIRNHFKIPAALIVNKADLNAEAAGEIERFCEAHGIRVVGRIPYDLVVVDAMLHKQTVTEYSDGPLSREIRNIWNTILQLLQGNEGPASSDKSASTENRE